MRCIFIFMSRKWRKTGSAWKTNSPGACLCAAFSSESLEAERRGFSFLKVDMVGTWHSSNASPRLGLPMQTTLPLAAPLWRLSNPASSQWHCWPWPLGQVKAEGEAALETSARYPKLWRCPQQPSREARCCCHFLVGGGDHIDNKPLFD